MKNNYLKTLQTTRKKEKKEILHSSDHDNLIRERSKCHSQKAIAQSQCSLLIFKAMNKYIQIEAPTPRLQEESAQLMKFPMSSCSHATSLQIEPYLLKLIMLESHV